jgi:hypothetical protein
MRKITVVLAALASLALAVPTIASAKDMHKDKMHHGMMHRDMAMHHHHHHHTMHHVMKKQGM